MIVGLSIFLSGMDIGISPIGQLMGKHMAKSNSIVVVVIAGLVLGFMVSIAEPDLQILSNQIDFVTSGALPQMVILITVSIGIAVMLTVGLIRILTNTSLSKMIIVLYGIIFVLACFTSSEFLAISFDASGATTGALTVPFILSLALGISSLKKDGKASEQDSFGLVAITSTGAIISVLLLSILKNTEVTGESIEMEALVSNSVISPFLHELPGITYEILIALLPLVILFLIFQKVLFKESKKHVKKILKGVLYTWIGLVLFLVGVNAGFMDVGRLIGYKLALFENKTIVIGVAFVLSLVVIMAEPAVYVLTEQIENVTSGYVKRTEIVFALAIGVGFSVALSIIRILVPQIQLWHYLLPGYLIAIIMMYFVPKLFIGIAFDSGGVASGPLTATFILAFAQGVAEATEGANVLIDGFGIIAMVALSPLISLQILGLIFKLKSKKGGFDVE